MDSDRIKAITNCLGTNLLVNEGSVTTRNIMRNLIDISYALGLSYEEVEETNSDTQQVEEKDKYINVRLNYPYPNHVPEEEEETN